MTTPAKNLDAVDLIDEYGRLMTVSDVTGGERKRCVELREELRKRLEAEESLPDSSHDFELGARMAQLEAIRRIVALDEALARAEPGVHVPVMHRAFIMVLAAMAAIEVER